MPPKKQKKKRAAKKPQALPRSVQALLKYLGGADVKLGASRPVSAAQQVQQSQQAMQQPVQYQQSPQQAPAKAAAKPRGRPRKTGDIIAPSPIGLAGLAPAMPIFQQSGQQQADTKKIEESQKQIQADIAQIKVKQEKAERQTPIETLAFFQSKPDVPKFAGQFPTRSEFSAAAKQPALTGPTPSFASGRTPRSMLQSMFEETQKRLQGVSAEAKSVSSRSSERTLTAPSISGAEGVASLGEHLAQKFIGDVTNPEKMPAKKLRGRPAKAKAQAQAPLQFEGQTGEQALATFQQQQPPKAPRKPRVKKSAMVIPQGVDPSTQIGIMAGGGAVKQARGKSLKELSSASSLP
jgi:hypothetical protein